MHENQMLEQEHFLAAQFYQSGLVQTDTLLQEAYFRAALSRNYYALFHQVVVASAEALVSNYSTLSLRLKDQILREPNHAFLQKSLQNFKQSFGRNIHSTPEKIITDALLAAYEARLQADYSITEPLEMALKNKNLGLIQDILSESKAASFVLKDIAKKDPYFMRDLAVYIFFKVNR
jgi:hypothetical protein